jgi:hypothetical protein
MHPKGVQTASAEQLNSFSLLSNRVSTITVTAVLQRLVININEFIFYGPQFQSPLQFML